MLSIAFSAWTTLGNTATAHFQVDDNFGDGIAQVLARAYRTGDPLPPFVDAPLYRASVDITQYAGSVTVDVRATDLVGRAIDASNTFAVGNFIAPSPPDFLSYASLTPLGLVLSWGVSIVSPTVVTWRVINTSRTGIASVLADVPVSSRGVAIVTDTSRLYRLSIVGVDAHGHQGASSPALVFARDANGPQVVLADIALGAGVAIARWDIASTEIITDVAWQFGITGLIADANGALTVPYVHETTGKGLPADTASLALGSVRGVAIFSITASDLQDRRTTVTKQLAVYLVAPAAPTLVVTQMGFHSITVRATPAVGDAGLAHITIFGPGGQVDLPPPYERTFTGLLSNTSYTFSARSVNRSGLAGSISAPISSRTFLDISPPPPTIAPYQGGPLLPYLLPLLTDDLRHYVLQLFTDTRIRSPLAPQIVSAPNGFEPVLNYMRQIGPYFGTVLRTEANDPATHAASLLIDKTPDPLAKLAIFCERLEFGDIWNPG